MKRNIIKQLIEEQNSKEETKLARLLFKSEAPASSSSSNTDKLFFPKDLVQDDESMAVASNHRLREDQGKDDDLLERSQSNLLDPTQKSRRQSGQKKSQQ
jgi:hypothetical protein